MNDIKKRNNQYKALILDLDGTTIPNKVGGMPSGKVIRAIKKAQAKVFVSVATGRTLHLAAPILDVLHITSPVILLGGSQIINGASRRFIYERLLEKKDLPAIFEVLDAYHLEIVVDEKEQSIVYKPPYTKVPYNILVKYSSEKAADEIMGKLSHITTIALHKMVSWKKGFVDLDISHVSATKQHGILKVAEILGIETHDIIGVGDGYNDFPLLMACGLKVAMGNAVPELKEIADYIAPTVEEDGVADVIEKFVLRT